MEPISSCLLQIDLQSSAPSRSYTPREVRQPQQVWCRTTAASCCCHRRTRRGFSVAGRCRVCSPLSLRIKVCRLDHAAAVSPLAAQGRAAPARSGAEPSPPATATNQHELSFSLGGRHRVCNPLPSHPGVPAASANKRSSTCVGTVPVLCRLDTSNPGHIHVRGLPIPIGGTASGACRFIHLRHTTYPGTSCLSVRLHGGHINALVVLN